MELDRSQALHERARRVDAAFTSGASLGRDQLVDGAYPIFGTNGLGPRIWDVDGNEFLDFILAFGTVILGHADPAVSDAVSREIRDGFSLTVRKEVQVALAELLVEVIPGAEQVLLLKTGSDATTAAVRLARAYTGRDRVLRWGYHGWHDWCAARSDGIPSAVRELTHAFDYDNLGSLDAALRAHRGEVACVIMMPFELQPPSIDFLRGVVGLAHSHGALFVLDELRTGFRIALGGAQERYSIEADLVTLGKAMSNGYALSAVAGPTKIMGLTRRVHIGSTYFSNSLAMAAARATIEQLRDGHILGEIERHGLQLVEGLASQIDEHGIHAQVLGVPQMPFVQFDYGSDALNTLASSIFYSEVATRGILMHPAHHWFLCGSLSDDDLAVALSATAPAFDKVAEGALSWLK